MRFPFIVPVTGALLLSACTTVPGVITDTTKFATGVVTGSAVLVTGTALGATKVVTNTANNVAYDVTDVLTPEPQVRGVIVVPPAPFPPPVPLPPPMAVPPPPPPPPNVAMIGPRPWRRY